MSYRHAQGEPGAWERARRARWGARGNGADRKTATAPRAYPMGVVMRAEALREATARAAKRASPKLKTRLSKGEKSGRKRIAEVGAVYEIEPAPRTPAEVLAPIKDKTLKPPRAKHKWVTASVVDDAASVVCDIFDEAERRDGDHRHRWVALVDGNNHQIDRIRTDRNGRSHWPHRGRLKWLH